MPITHEDSELTGSIFMLKLLQINYYIGRQEQWKDFISSISRKEQEAYHLIQVIKSRESCELLSLRSASTRPDHSKAQEHLI